jgi:putative acetyltransferase
MILIRDEIPADLATIYELNRLAFGRAVEAELVDRLRQHGKLLISLVAVEDGEVLGHIAFSRVWLVPATPGLSGAGLAPLAVLPERQGQGIGSELCRQGLERCRRLGLDYAILFGHPGYYPRFGFKPASQYRLTSKWPAPDDAFMALELRPAALQTAGGMVEFEPEFDEFA